MKKTVSFLGGLSAGILNGLFGAGGGMLIVPLLKKNDIDQNAAHATAISVIFPLSILSAILYLTSGKVVFSDATPYLLPGIAGALFGAWLLPKIPEHLLRRIFGGFMIWAAIRLFLR